jgi:hypothetical protein
MSRIFATFLPCREESNGPSDSTRTFGAQKRLKTPETAVQMPLVATKATPSPRSSRRDAARPNPA